MSVWVPKQYGAWAMLVAPVITGLIMAPGWGQAGIAVAWVTAYLSYMAVRGALGRRHRHEYATAGAVYGVVTAGLVVAELVWRPALVWWVIPLAVLLGVSLWLVASGRERTTINDAALTGASALMTAVVATAGRLGEGAGWHGFATGVAWPAAWVAVACLAAYFWGTIPYVKTMIRERGHVGWYAASVAYHAALIVPAFLVNLWVWAFGIVVAARAVLVPKLAPKAKPKQIGVAEIGVTIVLVAILCTTLGG